MTSWIAQSGGRSSPGFKMVGGRIYTELQDLQMTLPLGRAKESTERIRQ